MNNIQTFLEQTIENGVAIYKIPTGFRLFKAFRMTREEEIQPFIIGQPYFFGMKNMTPEYIESYEEEYGIIYEFETTRSYTLLALDNPLTQQTLFDSAPENIQTILKNNYGYFNKIRVSESESDRILSQYLCREGYDGYALHGMKTYGDGIFHDELMICKADSMKLVGLVTLPERKAILFQNNKSKEMSRQLRESRKKKREGVMDAPSPFTSPMPLPSKKLARSLFDDDDDNDFIRGGIKTRKQRVKVLRKKRNTRNTRRKKTSSKKKSHRKK
jgi:hypothetical protein